MLKKLWIAASIGMSLTAGLFLYEGGKLLFVYRDRRLGLLISAAGIAAGCSFLWSFCESLRTLPDTEEKLEKRRRTQVRDAVIAYVAFGLGLAGVVSYQMRFYSLTTTVICAGGMFTLQMLLLWAIRGVSSFTHLQEQEFQKRLQAQTAAGDWEGYMVYDEDSVKLDAYVLECKNSIQTSAGFIFALCMSALLNISRLRFMTVVIVVIGLVCMYLLKLWLAIKTAGKVVTFIKEGKDKSLLGFFEAYYACANCKADSVDSLILLNVVPALCNQGAYRQAEELLRTLRRPAKMEAYFIQYEWICREGMVDREGCIEALGRFEQAILRLKGKNKESMQRLYELFADFTYLRYEKVIEASKKLEGLSKPQREYRLKLAEDAENKIFGIEKEDA